MNKPEMKIITYPTPKPEKCYDFDECIEFLEKNHNVDFRDWAKSEKHYVSWCKSKGYGQIDPKGKSMYASTVWFAKYKKDPNGYKKRPPVQDFWRAVLLSLYDIQNGKITTINYLKDKPKLKEQWQHDAFKMIHDEFSDNDGKINFYISW